MKAQLRNWFSLSRPQPARPRAWQSFWPLLVAAFLASGCSWWNSLGCQCRVPNPVPPVEASPEPWPQDGTAFPRPAMVPAGQLASHRAATPELPAERISDRP